MTFSPCFMRKNIIVVSGGPGFGKTSLIKELRKLGLKTGEEAAREIISDQAQKDGDILPWLNITAFQEAVLEKRISFWESVRKDELAFCDRAIPDQLVFARFRGFKPSKKLEEAAESYQYYRDVLICPPWKDIYIKDDVRKESFSDACRLHDLICQQYADLGYRLINLPQTTEEERVEFIKDQFALILK